MQGEQIEVSGPEGGSVQGEGVRERLQKRLERIGERLLEDAVSKDDEAKAT